MARSIRLVVVDDTEHVRKMLTSMLTLDGFEVVGEASGGAEAVAQATELEPDVVVMDFRMPGMDGLSASRGIRARCPDQAIVLYTAYIDEDLEDRAAEAGIALCLDKVEGLESLERELSRLCTSLL